MSVLSAKVDVRHNTGTGLNGRSDDLNRTGMSAEQLFKERVARILKSLGAKGPEHKRLAAKLGLSDRALDYLTEEDRGPHGDTRARIAELLLSDGRLDDACTVLRVDLRPIVQAMMAEQLRRELQPILDRQPGNVVALEGRR